MAQFLRRRGVWGYNTAPRVNAISIVPAQYYTVGVEGLASRQFAEKLTINGPGDLDFILGPYRVGALSRYCFDTFYANTRTQPAQVIWKSFQPANAVQAFRNLVDLAGSPLDTLKAASAYKNIVDKSADGNLTGLTLIKGSRFKTTVAANASIGATSIALDSLADVQVGDYLGITSAGPTTQYVKVSAVDQGAGTATIGALTGNIVVGDVVNVMGFQISTYRKNYKGVVSLVNLPQNKIWLSLEPENTAYYVNNAFKQHPLLSLLDLASATSGFNSWPADITTPVFLQTGANGTTPSSANDWAAEHAHFTGSPIRWLLNLETSLIAVNKQGEAYCNSRLDTPVWMNHVPAQQTRDQLIAIGQSYQRADQVQSVTCASYRNVLDPIGIGDNPVVAVPIHFAVVGRWLYDMYTTGFHNGPAGEKSPLLGFQSTPDSTEDKFTNGNSGTQDIDDVTLCASAGVNVAQEIPGKGIFLQTFRTPTTATTGVARFGNAFVLQNFVKASAVESLGQFSNTVNTYKRLTMYAQSVRDFGKKLFRGSFPFGIAPNEGAFGDFIKDDGTPSGFDDVFKVQADQFNNDFTAILNGDANLECWLFSPPLLDSLGVGVGFLIP